MKKFYYHKFDTYAKCFTHSRETSIFTEAGDRFLMMNDNGNWHLAFSNGFVTEKEDSMFGDIYDNAVSFGNYIETEWPEEWAKIL